jgi:hypothetical protein
VLVLQLIAHLVGSPHRDFSSKFKDIYTYRCLAAMMREKRTWWRQPFSNS